MEKNFACLLRIYLESTNIEVTPNPKPTNFVSVIGSRNTINARVTTTIVSSEIMGKITLPCPPDLMA